MPRFKLTSALDARNVIVTLNNKIKKIHRPTHHFIVPAYVEESLTQVNIKKKKMHSHIY